jgi:hypothetical protein
MTRGNTAPTACQASAVNTRVATLVPHIPAGQERTPLSAELEKVANFTASYREGMDRTNRLALL